MPLRPHLRAYLCSVIYAGALLFIPLFGPRLFGATLLQLAIVASLLVLLVVLISHRNEVVELVLSVFRACGNVVLCLLQVFTPEWVPVAAEAISADPFRAVLFQRPPPRLA
jgi:hypothetical protein